MSITFACPGCGKRFKVDDDKAGRKGKCPSCAAAFEIPSGVDTARAQKTVPHPEPKRRAAPAEDDERDEPRRRPARADDERARDEEPRRRPAEGAAEDDYADEDRPRRRRKKKKPKSSSGLIVGLVGGVLALLLLIVGIVWAVVSLSGSSTVADDLKYLPDNSEAIVVFNFSKFRASDLYKRLRAETSFFDNLVRQGGGQVEDLENADRATFGGYLGDGTGVAVVRSSRAVNLEAEATRGTRKYPQEEVYGGHKVRHDGLQGIAAPERKLLLMGPVIELRKILERGGRKATLSAPLQSAFDELDLTKHFAGAWDGQAATGGREQPGAVPFIANQVTKPESMLIHLDAGAELAGSMTFNCKSAQEAENLKKQTETTLQVLQKLPGIPSEVTNILKKLQLVVSGSRLNVQVSMDNNTVIDLAKKMPALPRH